MYTDAAFWSNLDHTSPQLGYLALLGEATGKGNVLNYSSSKSKRVARSLLGFEVFAFADRINCAFCIKKDLEEFLNRSALLEVLTVSKCLFAVITRSSPCREKRLLIDIAVVQEASVKQDFFSSWTSFFKLQPS